MLIRIGVVIVLKSKYREVFITRYCKNPLELAGIRCECEKRTI